LSGVDPALLSEFLYLVVEEEGMLGLAREMPAYEKTRPSMDVRLNATLSCFSALVFIAVGEDKSASENLVSAIPYFHLANRLPVFGGDEGLVCGVILRVLSEKLGDPQRAAGFSEFLRRYPVERVNGMKELFSRAITNARL
jgi:hypothetical protein